MCHKQMQHGVHCFFVVKFCEIHEIIDKDANAYINEHI